MRTLALSFLTLALNPTAALCQSTTSPLARADITASIGSFSANHTEVADWGGWGHSFLSGLGAGYYWTDHIRSEIGVDWATQHEVYGTEPLPFPGDPFARLYAQHYYNDVTISAAQAYQFGRNAWFHPYVAAGVDISRERHEKERPAQFLPVRSATGAIVQTIRVPALEETETTVNARPFASTGFKAYVSDRAFFRTELKLGFDNRVEHVRWKIGFGVDF